MPTLKILAEAAEEAEAAADWYEREQPGLSRQFRDVLNSGLDLLEQGVVTGSALPGPSGNEGIRHLVLRRFPYDIIFVSHHNSITVLALLTTRDAQGTGEIVLSVSARNKRRKERASGERRSESSRTGHISFDPRRPAMAADLPVGWRARGSGRDLSGRLQ